LTLRRGAITPIGVIIAQLSLRNVDIHQTIIGRSARSIIIALLPRGIRGNASILNALEFRRNKKASDKKTIESR
ncbi:hypothetical protein ABTL72_19515, partial [Acinetobacter baumannii]